MRKRLTILKAQHFVARTKADLEAFLTNPPATLIWNKGRYGYNRGVEVTLERPTGFDPVKSYAGMPGTYPTIFRNRQNVMTNDIRMVEEEIVFLQKRLADWRPV